MCCWCAIGVTKCDNEKCQKICCENCYEIIAGTKHDWDLADDEEREKNTPHLDIIANHYYKHLKICKCKKKRNDIDNIKIVNEFYNNLEGEIYCIDCVNNHKKQ
jgi:hypothetical protein